jgi:ankyrin repeat protein
MSQLTQLIGAILKSNPTLSARMETSNSQSEDSFDLPQNCQATVLQRLQTQSVLSFERTLVRTRVYKKAVRNISTNSFNTTTTSTSKWSQLTGLSLSQISSVAVICLPVYVDELHSGYLFDNNEYDSKANEGSTALHNAARNGCYLTVRLLVETLGANTEARDSEGRTALHLAATMGHDTTVRLLVETLGANKEAKSNNGQTALHYAAQYGHDMTVLLLIGALDSDIEARDNNGWTALQWAADKW